MVLRLIRVLLRCDNGIDNDCDGYFDDDDESLQPHADVHQDRSPEHQCYVASHLPEHPKRHRDKEGRQCKDDERCIERPLGQLQIPQGQLGLLIRVEAHHEFNDEEVEPAHCYHNHQTSQCVEVVVANVVLPLKHPSEQRQDGYYACHTRVYRANNEVRGKDGCVPTLDGNLDGEVPRHDAVNGDEYRKNQG